MARDRRRFPLHQHQPQPVGNVAGAHAQVARIRMIGATKRRRIATLAQVNGALHRGSFFISLASFVPHRLQSWSNAGSAAR